jgi:hypothetical protein
LQIKSKCRSKQNDLAAGIRSTVFSTFGAERLPKVDGNTTGPRLVQWKANPKTHEVYCELFSNPKILQKIGTTVFKKYDGSELPLMHCAFILAICDILLNSESPGIKCNDHLVTKRVYVFMVNCYSAIL